MPLDAHGNPVAIDLDTRPDTFNDDDQVELDDVSDQNNSHIRYQVGFRSVHCAEGELIIVCACSGLIHRPTVGLGKQIHDVKIDIAS